MRGCEASHFSPPPPSASLCLMTKLEHIQSTIETLDTSEIARLRAWLDELDARLFDEKIERDAEAGKLDALAERALAEHARGLSRKL